MQWHLTVLLDALLCFFATHSYDSLPPSFSQVMNHSLRTGSSFTSRPGKQLPRNCSSRFSVRSRDPSRPNQGGLDSLVHNPSLPESAENALPVPRIPKCERSRTQYTPTRPIASFRSSSRSIRRCQEHCKAVRFLHSSAHAQTPMAPSGGFKHPVQRINRESVFVRRPLVRRHGPTACGWPPPSSSGSLTGRAKARGAGTGQSARRRPPNQEVRALEGLELRLTYGFL